MTVETEHLSESAQSTTVQVDTTQHVVHEHPLHPNGTNGNVSTSARHRALLKMREGLPTFPEDAGWREVKDPQTGIVERLPLTLHDFLYPTEDDIGVVNMSQSFLHEFWINVLATIFRTYLDPSAWFIFCDVNVYWHRGTASPSVPDIAVVPGGKQPITAKVKSYHVGEGAPLPSFVLEVTSRDTRDHDLNFKRLHYAAMGVREYLIVDIETPSTEGWQILGYRLDNSSPFYQPITPDAEGGLTFDSIGLRFVAVESSEIVVYDIQTGERLQKPDELLVRAESAETRAESAEARAEEEAAARRQKEEENAALKAEVELLKQQQANSNSNSG